MISTSAFGKKRMRDGSIRHADSIDCPREHHAAQLDKLIFTLESYANSVQPEKKSIIKSVLDSTGQSAEESEFIMSTLLNAKHMYHNCAKPSSNSSSSSSSSLFQSQYESMFHQLMNDNHVFIKHIQSALMKISSWQSRGTRFDGMNECLPLIFSFIGESVTDFVNTAKVCRTWFDIARNNSQSTSSLSLNTLKAIIHCSSDQEPQVCPLNLDTRFSNWNLFVHLCYIDIDRAHLSTLEFIVNKCPKVKKLKVNCTNVPSNISDVSSVIANFSQLESLSLFMHNGQRKVQRSKDGCELIFGSCKSLKSLSLCFPGKRDKIQPHFYITQLDSAYYSTPLKKISFQNLHITNKSLQFLAESCSQLILLSLTDCSFENTSTIDCLSKLSNLERLIVYSNDESEDEQMAHSHIALLDILRNCQSINLLQVEVDWSDYDEEISCWPKCEKTTIVDMSKWCNVNENIINSLVRSCPNLKEVACSYLTQLNQLLAFVNCSKLRRLLCSMTHEYSNESRLLERCHDLFTTECNGLTGWFYDTDQYILGTSQISPGRCTCDSKSIASKFHLKNCCGSSDWKMSTRRWFFDILKRVAEWRFKHTVDNDFETQLKKEFKQLF